MKKYTVIMVVALILGFLVGVYLYKINGQIRYQFKNCSFEISLNEKRAFENMPYLLVI